MQFYNKRSYRKQVRLKIMRRVISYQGIIRQLDEGDLRCMLPLLRTGRDRVQTAALAVSRHQKRTMKRSQRHPLEGSKMTPLGTTAASERPRNRSKKKREQHDEGNQHPNRDQFRMAGLGEKKQKPATKKR